MSTKEPMDPFLYFSSWPCLQYLLIYLSIYSPPPASPSTQEAIQGMLSMANLQSSDSCLQTSWSNNQSKNNSHTTQSSKKTGNGNNKRPAKRPLKKSTKSSSVDSVEMFEDEQDHLHACFKDSDYGRCWNSPNSTSHHYLSPCSLCVGVWRVNLLRRQGVAVLKKKTTR